jgi:hypothetical protein
MLIIGIAIGLVLGVWADFLLLRYGIKPVLLVSAVMIAFVITLAFTTDINVVGLIAMLIVFGSTRFVAGPLLRRTVH